MHKMSLYKTSIWKMLMSENHYNKKQLKNGMFRNSVDYYFVYLVKSSCMHVEP